MVLETQDKNIIFNGVRTEYMYVIQPEDFLYNLGANYIRTS